MTNGSEDFNDKPMKRLQHTQTMRKNEAYFFVFFYAFFTAVSFSRSFHGLFTVQILWEISGRYFYQIIFCFVFGDIMI
jgi:negative regulator of genetic competence, sporulation and motility